MVTSRGSGPSGDLGIGGGDLLVFADAMSLAHGRLPLGFIRQDDHHCHGNLMGVDHAITITCKDAKGADLAKCDSTTDSATITLKQTGNLMTPNLTAAIDREGNFTITGLQSDTATFSGDSSFTADATLRSIFRPGATATYSFDTSASYDAIKIAMQQRQIELRLRVLRNDNRRSVFGDDGDSESLRGRGVHAATGRIRHENMHRLGRKCRLSRRQPACCEHRHRCGSHPQPPAHGSSPDIIVTSLIACQLADGSAVRRRPR